MSLARITGWSLVAGDGPEVTDVQPRRDLPNRKHLKLMSRAVRLGVVAVGRALEARPGWDGVPPRRRGMYVGATPVGADVEALLPALGAAWEGASFDVAAFGEVGVPLVPPLWLVKGLSNNILGFASAYWDFRGVNGNRVEGRAGGLAAILDGARAIAEGRADLVVAGGADSLLHAGGILGRTGGEAAAFVVLEPVREGGMGPVVRGGRVWADPRVGRPSSGARGELGAAAGPVELVERLARGEVGPFSVEVAEEMGVRATLEVGAPG